MSTKIDSLRGRLSSFLVVTLASTLVLLGCAEESPPAPASPSPSPAAPSATPIPTASPAPANPDLGRLYHQNGQYEEAIAVFRSVVAGAKGPARQEARLSLATTYLELQRYQEALAELDAYLGLRPAPAETSTARFLRARALAALDRPAEAADDYARYLAAGGPAEPYARLGRARALASLGRPGEAVSEVQAALANDLPASVHAQALLFAAQALEQAGDLPGAHGWYDRLQRESDSPADRALARWRQADLARRQGDPSWAQAAGEVLAAYPATASALEALEALQMAGEPVDGYLAGLVLYRHFRDAEAVQALEANLESSAPSRPAESSYYLAAARERLGEEDAALEAYGLSLMEDAQGPLADDAAWWRARLLEAMGRLDEAQSAYSQLLSAYPTSTWAAEARFRQGLVSYKQGRFQEAADSWLPILSASHAPLDQGRALLWLAKAEATRGDDGAAEAYLRRVVALPRPGYFGLRAVALLTEEPPPAEPVDITQAAPNWSASDSWAAALATPQEVPFDPTSDSRWTRARELLALGLYDESQAEFGSLLSAPGTSPARLYRLARALDALGQTHLAARAATLLLERLSPAAAEAAPSEVRRLAYPTGFASLVETVSRREGVSAALLLALIRQESFFDPRAGSSAGALGLTQVIPSTGEDIAHDLGIDEFEAEDLLRPSVSIRFGARYLKRQLVQFDGAVPEALAAYNGGPGNARRWSRAAHGDPDLFLEEIDLPETRAYVRLVSENLARYQELYASP